LPASQFLVQYPLALQERHTFVSVQKLNQVLVFCKCTADIPINNSQVATGIGSGPASANGGKRFEADSEFDPGGVTLITTNACSMRCIYCYAKGGDNAESMSWGSAKLPWTG
jgi:sulfatase maturation enzyme AslB (radical SAM superfamily)